MQLYTYFRSSASYRVRIALNLKGLEARHVPISLIKGEQRTETYHHLNPQDLVPSLVLDGGQVLTQSLAIIEYLDETHPTPPLLPTEALCRARVRALSQAVACEMAPLNNLRVLHYLTGEMGLSDDQKLQWYRHWIATGFTALEVMLQAEETGQFCHGDTPTLADCCLVPQVYNAERFECDLTPYPTIRRIHEACNTLPAFANAHPARQPDAPSV